MIAGYAGGDSAVWYGSSTGATLATVVVLLLATLNLFGSFVEMATSLKQLHNLDRLKVPLIVYSVLVGAAMLILMVMGDYTRVYYVASGVVFTAWIAALVGPGFLWFKFASVFVRGGRSGSKDSRQSKAHLSVRMENSEGVSGFYV